jgi:hypothetical protein
MRLHRSKDISVHVLTLTSYDFSILTPLCGSCVADKTRISGTRRKKISDWVSEQGINIKFCVKLENNASETCAVMS